MPGKKTKRRWLFSEARRRFRAFPGLVGETLGIARVRTCLNRVYASELNAKSCRRCLNAMRKVEKEAVSKNYYKPPFYYWKSRISVEQKSRFRRSWHMAFESESGFREKLCLIALAVRLAPVDAILDKFLKELPSDLWEQLGISLMEELFGLLHSQRQYQILYDGTGHVLKRKDLDIRRKRLFCDFYFQASYQMLKSRIFHNKLTACDVEKLRQDFSRCSSLLGRETGNVAHYEGLLACVEGNLDAAIGHHVRAQKMPGYNTQFFRSALNVIPLDTVRELSDTCVDKFPENPEFYSELNMVMRHKPSSDVTLVACDEHYFYTFLQGFAESFALQNVGGQLHIHAVAFDPPDKKLTELEQAFGISINVTLDPGPKGVTSDMWRGYCAGARYIHLPRYLRHYKRIIVNDIDGIVHKSMAQVWARNEGHIMLSTPVLEKDRIGHFAFWSNIGAGAFAIENSPDHIKFAQAQANFLTRRFGQCLRNGERFFFSDQVGLLLCVLAFRDEISMVSMPQIFRQSSQTAQAGRQGAKKNAQLSMLEKEKAKRRSNVIVQT